MIKKLLIPLLVLLLTGCYDETEPDNISYVTAVGIDKSEKNEDNFNFTIQFAKTSAISGGASEEGGKGGDIVENIVIESPTLYSAVDTVNQIVSKNISMSHISLIVFSSEVAREGVANLTEALIRSQEIRPNIYFAVSVEKAEDYLKNVKPVIEINPTKYYQLVFKNNNYGGIPKNPSYNFIFNQEARTHDNVLPLVGVIEEEKKDGEEGGESSGSSGGGESSEGGESGESGGSSQSSQSSGTGNPSDTTEKNEMQKEAPINKEEFNYNKKNYLAGQVGLDVKNKAEAMGIAIFDDERLVGMLGSIDSLMYNILAGTYRHGYMSFNATGSEIPITVHAEAQKLPHVTYDKNTNTATIKIFLEGDFVSMAQNSYTEQDIGKFEQEAESAITEYAYSFLNRVRDEYNSDIIGIGESAKTKFLTEKDFEDYKWEEKFKTLKYNIYTEFKIRRSGLIIRK